VDDLLEVIMSWGVCQPFPCPADANGDGAINVDDIVQIILSWGACEGG
jgi:hypothetical protein